MTIRQLQLGEIFNLSNDREDYYSGSPHLAFSRRTGSLFVIWHKAKGIYGGGLQLQKDKANKSSLIVYRLSKDRGVSFRDMTMLHDFKDKDSFGLPVSFTHPQLSGGYDDKIFITLVDKSSPEKFDVYLSRDSEDGKSLEPPRIVSDPDTGLIDDTDSGSLNKLVEGKEGSTWKRVLSYVANASAEKVYVLWVEMKTTKLPSELDEATKEELQRGLSGSTMEQFREMNRKAAKAMPRYQIDYEMFFKASMDSGKTFGKRINLLKTSGYSPGFPYAIGPASLAASGNNAYIFIDALGADPANRRVRFYKSSDDGMTFDMKELAVELNSEQMVANAVRPAIISPNPDSLYLMETLFTKHRLEQPVNLEEMLMGAFDYPKHTTIVARSNDAGTTFTSLASLPEATADSRGTPFAVSKEGTNVYIATIDPGHGFDFMRDLMHGKIPKPEGWRVMGSKDTGGTVLIRTSNDGGATFGPAVSLKDSKHIGAVGEFGTNVLLLPFHSDGLIALKTRSINIQPTKSASDVGADANQVEESHGSEVLMWTSLDGGKTFEGPLKASGDIKQSQLSWGSIVVEDTGVENQVPIVKLYLVWQGGFFQGYSDVHFRELTIA